MRICIPIQGTFDSTYGGGQTYVRNLANALRDRGHDVTVLEGIYSSNGHSERPVRTSLQEDGIRLMTVCLPSPVGSSAQRTREAAVRACLLAAAPDIVHANGLKDLVVRVCKDLRIPCLVTAHHGGLVCPAGALLDYKDQICARPIEQKACTHCCASRLPLAPLWVALFSLLPSSMSLAIGRAVRWLPFVPYLTPALCTPSYVQSKGAEVDELISKATAIVSPSQAIRAALLRNGAKPERTVVIPHGVPFPEKVEPYSRTAARPIRFLYVGRLSRVKGLHVLVRAFNQLRDDAELHVVGRSANKSEGKYWTSVVKEIRRRERFIEHGYLAGDALQEIMTACDVLVLPSICVEAFGLTVAESLAAGRPVITTDSGGPAEQIVDGVNGLVVEPNSTAALASAMQKLVEDPQLIQRLARNIRPPESITAHAEAIVALYSQCIDRCQAGSPVH